MGKLSDYERILLKGNAAAKAKKKQADLEFKLFKSCYLKLITDNKLTKKELFFKIQAEFRKQNLKLNRSKFFVLQNKIQDEELKKDWWVTKRKKEIEERNQKLREQGAKEIQMIVIDANGEDMDQFISKKSKAIKKGIIKGSQKGAKTTKGKFI